MLELYLPRIGEVVKTVLLIQVGLCYGFSLIYSSSLLLSKKYVEH